jgi:hypothetical protein
MTQKKKRGKQGGGDRKKFITQGKKCLMNFNPNKRFK